MIGREEEIQTLREALEKPEAQFIAVYGRRRVGKTYLVRETFAGKFAFYHTGVANVGMGEQLLNFRDSLVKYGYAGCPMLKNWREAFLALEHVIESSNDARKVIFIDELPWLDTRQSQFVPALEHFWNGWASARKDVVLIVCGSATSWMISKVIKDHGGLHNRVTERIHLLPFTLRECEQYANAAGLDFSREDICRTYMALGGIPFYWDLLKRGKSVNQNMDALFFSENGKLRGEFNELFCSLFKESKLHRSMVEILARRGIGMTREDVLKGLKISDGGKITKCLEELEQCGFVRSYTAFGKKKRDTLFQLIDNLALFHLRFVAGESNPDENFWSNTSLSSAQAAWRGLAFERVCLQHLRQIKRGLQIGGVVTHVCSWRHVPDEVHTQGAQIDLLIDRADGVIDVCEMKYCSDKYAPDKRSDEEMRRRLAVFEAVAAPRKAIRAVLVTPFGIERNAYSSRFSNILTFDDLFAPKA